MAKLCHQCGEPYREKVSPGFRETCLQCGAALHCCANCRFYDANARPWCREPQAREEMPGDAVVDNRCSFFLFGERDAGAAERARKAREGLAGLFGEQPAEPQEKPDWMRVDKPPDKPDKPIEDELFGEK